MKILYGTIILSKEEYFRLRMSEAKLDMLYSGGVDNWEGMSYSYWENGVKLDEVEADLRLEIFGENSEIDRSSGL